MELCTNTLNSFIEQMNTMRLNILTIEEYKSVCEVFIKLLKGVQYLHSLDPPIIHRDLKPENILLITDENGSKVKLSDFGLSTYHNYIDQSHTKYIGTTTYRAPEVDKRKYDTKADIYSLGKVMEKLFNFDLDSENNEIDVEIQSCYEYAKQICIKCVSYTAKQRPNCQQILNQTHLWNFRSLSKHEIERDSELNERLFSILIKKWPILANIKSELFSNCKLLVIVDELEEKVIFATKDGMNYAIRVNNHIDSKIQAPNIIPELINKNIQSIVYGYEHVICLTKDMNVYSFGGNDYGQLGNRTFINNNRPLLIEEIKDKRIIFITCGAYHSVALTQSGNVFVWGEGTFGQIGNRSSDNTNTPIQINSLISIVSVSCGFRHCLALSKSGILLGWGYNECGQLGIQNFNNQSYPVNIKFEVKTNVKKIRCGRDHSLVLTTNNEICSLCHNTCGQLGIGNYIDQYKPKKIRTLIEFIDIETTFYHNISVGLSRENKYYVWGECIDGFINQPIITNFTSFDEVFDYNSITRNVFQKINTNQSFKKIISFLPYKQLLPAELSTYNQQFIARVTMNESKAIFVTNDDWVYSIRLNESIDNSDKKLVFVNELSNIGIERICFGIAHVLCLTYNNQVYSFGDNYFGQLGDGSQISNYKPTIITLLSNEQIIEISCGAYHCLALFKSGKLFVWGNGNYGQIGNGKNINQLTPVEIPTFSSIKIISISCGAYHCLALSSNGDLYGWGHNIFGQLCNKKEHYQYTPKLITNASKMKIKKISCGQHHSLLLTSNQNIYSFGLNSYGQLGTMNAENPKILTEIKFIDIYTSWCDNFSAGLSETGNYYIWGECGKNLISTPKLTDLTSFNEILIKYSRHLSKHLKLYND